MNHIRTSLLIAGILLLTACGKEDETAYFPTKEAAMDDFIQRYEITGNIDLITTAANEELLVVEQEKNNYFIGELLENKKGTAAEKLSANVIMELGGGWEFKSMAGRKYTVYFEKEQENQHYFPLSNGDYYVSLVTGHQITKETAEYENAIENLRAVKE